MTGNQKVTDDVSRDVVNLMGFRRGGDSAALPPAIYTALVDSLFQNYLVSFAGAVCAARGRADDGVQDRQ